MGRWSFRLKRLKRLIFRLKPEAPACPTLLDRVPERLRVFPNPNVPCDDGHERRRLAEQLCRREMQGIECANRFGGKRPARTGKDGVRDGHEIAATLESTERTCGCALLVGRQSLG